MNPEVIIGRIIVDHILLSLSDVLTTIVEVIIKYTAMEAFELWFV